MSMIDTGSLRKKMKVIMDAQPWIVTDTEFVKPGKGQAFSRIKMKNLISNRVLERTFKSGETIEQAEISSANMQYLFNNGKAYTFMNTQTYEQIEIPKEIMEEESKWLLESTECEVAFWGDKVISVTPPTFMDLVVTYAEPAVRGDTANNVTKKAKLETGAEIDVPLFVESGTKIRIDTRTGSYMQRAT